MLDERRVLFLSPTARLKKRFAVWQLDRIDTQDFSKRTRTRPAFAIIHKKKLSSHRIGAISSTRGKRDNGADGEKGTTEREIILSRRRNSYRFFGWQAGWRAISCQSACPGKGGGPFIRNRLKVQINKPCHRRFILNIRSRLCRNDLGVSSYYQVEIVFALCLSIYRIYACWYIIVRVQATCDLNNFKICINNLEIKIQNNF